MEHLGAQRIQEFLEELGKRYSKEATLLLLGGSALCLLGSSRPTVDIDYVGDDLRKNELQHMIDLVAEEMQVDIEPVPIEQFVPIPAGAESRWLTVG